MFVPKLISFCLLTGMDTNLPKKPKLPQPPTLYKAPANNINTAIFTSAANSSILANASGMNNNLVKKNMPKLLPAKSPAAGCDASGSGLKSVQANLALMPKLKPAAAVAGAQKSMNRGVPSKPPQLIRPDTVNTVAAAALKSQDSSAATSSFSFLAILYSDILAWVSLGFGFGPRPKPKTQRDPD